MRSIARPSLLAAVLAASSLAACRMPRGLDVPYVPTPHPVVVAMLELAEVRPDDVVYDLGSGDGRIVITAAKEYGIRKGVGVDIDPERVREARAGASRAGVEDRVTFLERDLFEIDLSEATVVTLYLGQDVNLMLRPKLRSQLRPGSRIVSHDFSMDDWYPDEMQVVNGRTIYLWKIK
jgi:SAM-dependent methyltransferase